MKKIFRIPLTLTMLFASTAIVACNGGEESGEESGEVKATETIEVKSAPTKVLYYADEDLSLDGLSVVKVVGGNETALAESDYTVDSSACDMTTAGEYEIKITSKANAELECSFKINVKGFFDCDYVDMSAEDVNTFFAGVDEVTNTYGKKFDFTDGYVYKETTIKKDSTTVKKFKVAKQDDVLVAAGTIKTGDSVENDYYKIDTLYTDSGTSKTARQITLDFAFDYSLASNLQKSRDIYISNASAFGYSVSDIKYAKAVVDGITKIKISIPEFTSGGATGTVTMYYAYNANYKLVGAKTVMTVSGAMTQDTVAEMAPYAGKVELPTDLDTYSKAA